ncbi:MAG TPA: aminoacyl--tRNA ligase-related protein, partial [Pirellulales bacterium]
MAENAELVKQNCANRGAKADIDRFLAIEADRKTLQLKIDQLNQQANAVSKSIGQAKDPTEREARKEEGRTLREQVTAMTDQLKLVTDEGDAILRMVPNLTHPEAPIGGEDAAKEIRRGKTPLPTFSFPPRDHVTIGENLHMMDFEGGAKVAGHGFYFLKNDAVLLELALQQYAIDKLIREGFTPTITPDVARNEILSGIGFIPRGPETQIYSVEGTDLSLVATAEITLGGLLSDTILESEKLPIKMCGISHCYRTEAGAHGRATRGLYRVHQFTKVEMFAFTLPEQSDEMLDYFCR